MRSLIIPSELLEAIRQQALEEMPNEACGYLAGTILPNGSRKAFMRIPMTNTDASPEHFAMSPKEQFAAVKTARDAGHSLISVYHSHPETPARMSLEDIRLANDTDTVYLIYSVPDDEIKGFTVNQSKIFSLYPVEVRP